MNGLRTRGWLRQMINNHNKKRRTENSKCQTVARVKVVIVGAGIAGLAAAKTLEERGFTDYLLLEAQDRLGGRIHSTMWNKHLIEYGAQFLHGDQSQLAELCYRNCLLSDSRSKDGEGIFLCGNGLRVDDGLILEIDDLVRTTLEECEKAENQNIHIESENIGRVLRSELRKHLRHKNDPPEIKQLKREIFDWNVRFLAIDNSCLTLDELSVKNWGKFKFIGGPEHISFKAGYSSIVKLIADGLSQTNLRLNTAVDVIEWKRRNVRTNDSDALISLILSNKSRIFADCVIVTCSLGYLKENHREMFDPPLPNRFTLGIESLGFGLINKIFLDFGTPWWESSVKGFQFLRSKRESKDMSDDTLAAWTRDLTGFDVLQDKQGVLLGWVGGHGAYIVEDLSEQQIATDCINLLRYHLKRNNIPTISKCKRTQWNANKYVRGSYSHIPTNCDAKGITPATLAEPLWGTVAEKNCNRDVPIVMFAGEATHESSFSTTHGAYATGVKQALNFLCYHAKI